MVLEDGVTRRDHRGPRTSSTPTTSPAAGRELVLLSGIEPHYHWRDFTALLIEVAEHTGAQVVVTLGAMPAQIAPQPHAARPRVVGEPRARAALRSAPPALPGHHRHRRHAAGRARRARRSRDLDAGRRALLRGRCAELEGVGRAPPQPRARHRHPHRAQRRCEERVAEWEQLVDDAVAENPEASGYLPQLEAEYDRQATEQLPSSDDLAAEFERYLRELDDPPS